MNDWVSVLSINELKSLAPPLFLFGDDPEDAAMYLYREGLSSPIMSAGKKDELSEIQGKERESRPPKKYWEQVKTEIVILLCTDDKKYKKLRSKLNSSSDKGTTLLLAAISASVGSAMGVKAGLISAFCAVILHSLVKIGKESYCAINV